MFILKHHAGNEERDAFVRRTRTICIYRNARPGIASKSLAHVKITRADTGEVAEGVFCVDAEGSKAGQIIAHRAHLPFPDGTEVTLEIREAQPSECVEWLLKNEDPERKAFGHILQSAIGAEGEAQRLYDLSIKTGAVAAENLRIATEAHADAKAAARQAERDKATGLMIGASGFVLGALLDVGLIEEKAGFDLPLGVIIGLCIIATALLVGAARLGPMLFLKDR